MTLKFKKENFIINNSPILINDVCVNEIVISSKLPIAKKDFKYFIGYKDFRTLCMLLPKYKTKYLYFDR